MYGVIRELGKNPENFEDRVKLGDEARNCSDLRGALVEYRAALKLKDDNETYEKAGAVYKLPDDSDKKIDLHPPRYNQND